MLQVMAFGGGLGESLFNNAIAASPYLPQQYGYKDFVPSQSYYAFASAVGCFGPPALPQNNISNSIFECLVKKDTATLQNASATVSGSSRYGTWAFLPVTDGVFIRLLPSQQLLNKQTNGNAMLVGVGHCLYYKSPRKLTPSRTMQTRGHSLHRRTSSRKMTLCIFYKTRFLSSPTRIFPRYFSIIHQPMLRSQTHPNLRHQEIARLQPSMRALLAQANNNGQM